MRHCVHTNPVLDNLGGWGGMMGKVRIEVQDQQGKWHRYVECSDSPTAYLPSLKQAARSSLARNSGKARAVDVKTGQVVDFEQV